jgi:hypothetical protein
MNWRKVSWRDASMILFALITAQATAIWGCWALWEYMK